jgi:hypothetical protein
MRSSCLSAPVRPTVRALTDTDGRPLRLYVDLPPGTRLSPAVPRALVASAPLGRIRIGTGEEGALRVALELDQSPPTRSGGTDDRDGRHPGETRRPRRPRRHPRAGTAARRRRAPRGREKIVLDPATAGAIRARRGTPSRRR